MSAVLNSACLLPKVAYRLLQLIPMPLTRFSDGRRLEALYRNDQRRVPISCGNRLLNGLIGTFLLLGSIAKFFMPLTEMFAQQIALGNRPFPRLSAFTGRACSVRSLRCVAALERSSSRPSVCPRQPAGRASPNIERQSYDRPKRLICTSPSLSEDHYRDAVMASVAGVLTRLMNGLL